MSSELAPDLDPATLPPPPAADPPFLQVLRSLPVRVWVCSAGSLVLQAGSFLPIFIVLYLTQRGHSAGAAGLVLGVSGLGSVLGSVVGGYLTDALGRQWTILLSVLGTAVLTAAVPYLGPLAAITVVVGLIGITSQAFRPAMAAVLADAVTPGQRLAAFGVLRFAMNVGVALSGVLGGVLVDSSYRALFLVEAGALLLFGLLVLLLLRDVPADAAAADEPAPRGGYRDALSDRSLVRFLVMTVLATFIFLQYSVGLPLHVHHVGLNAQHFGLLITLNGILVIALELPILGVVSRYRPERVLAAGCLLGGAGLALTGLADSMLALAGTVVVWTLGEMLYASVAQAHLVDLTPPSKVGRYQGLYGAAYTVGTGLGPAVGGAVYALHPWALWALVAVLGLIATQLSLRLAAPATPTVATEA